MRQELEAMVVQGDKVTRKKVEAEVAKVTGQPFSLELLHTMKGSQVVKVHLEVTKMPE